MTRTLVVLAVLCAAALASLAPAQAGLTRRDVLVIANSNSPASIAVAGYYKDKRGIPSAQVRTINCSTGDYLTMAEYASIRDQIAAHLMSLGSDPARPESDPIKVIVLCTKIPHMPTDAGERYSSLDSALAGLFNDATWGKEPLGVYGRFQPAPAALNSYYGDHRGAESFESFRSAAEVQYAAFPDPGFTLVRMLDSGTALAAGGSGILFRGVKSGGQWRWSPVADRDRGFIAWRVSSISVLDSARAYACTGSITRPHGGGTIIATSDGGLTWKRIRYSTRYGFKLKDALVGVDFADPSHGWAVGSSQVYYQPRAPLMIRTTNGGSSWQDLSASLPASFTPRAVSAADSGNVWVCGVGGIYRSTDGGTTWLAAMAGAPGVTYNAIRVKSEGGSYRGWAVGDAGTVLRTEDGSTWTVEANGLTTSNITDLSLGDSGMVCASFGGTGFLMYTPGSGWALRPASVSPVVSAAAGQGGILAVGGTRHILAESAGVWSAVYSGQDSPWRPRYLVCRLDGYNDDVDPADGIPDDIKAIIDRGHRASSHGRFVLDEATNVGVGSLASSRDALVPIVGSANVTYDTTSTFLTGQTNVIGYSSWGMHDGSANSYTTWGRPRNSWVDGGVVTVFESTDGRAFDRPHFVYNLNPGGTTYAGKLSVTGFVSAPSYAGYRAVLHSSDGQELASGVLVAGQTQIDIGGISWPADHKTYVQIYFPPDDIHHPGRALRDARHPASGADTSVYDSRSVGFSLVANPVRTLMAEYLREGASGGVCDVMEPWSSYIGQPKYLFPRYAQGFTWAESAYMAIPGIGWQEVVLGDPLMAPYSTPPSVSITSPAADGQVVAGTFVAAADVHSYGASGIARLEFWLDDDTLVASVTAAPYQVSIDTVALGIRDGPHAIEAIAVEAGEVGSAGSAFRTVVVNNSGHAFVPQVSDALAQPDGSLVGLLNRPVTGVFDGFFYIEEPDRARGIRVRSGARVNEGDLVTVLGALRTVDGEREILSPQ